MKIIERIHDRYVIQRRISVLVTHIASLIPQDSSVLDVGSGDGQIAAQLQRLRPDITVRGLEVSIRGECAIRVEQFDGRKLPLEDDSCDVVIFTDVLHHTDCPTGLVAEACRVAAEYVIIKDHLREGFAARRTLQFMDDIGNDRHGVPSPGNYLSRLEWENTLEEAGATIDSWNENLKIYPFPATLLFDRHLHFVTRVVPKKAAMRLQPSIS